MRDPYPGLDESTPAMPEASPLEPGTNVGRRRKKWRADNARRQGQMRALEQLSQKRTPIPEPLSQS